MWASFFIAILATTIILYLPGYFFFRSLKTAKQISFIIAPVFSILAYSALGILYEKIHIFSSLATITIPVLLFSLSLFVVSKLKNSETKCPLIYSWTGGVSTNNLIILLYLSLGIIATVFIFSDSLYSLDAITQTYDNVFHYNLAQSFLNSGIWSSLSASLYLDQNPQYAAFCESGYYPSAWHIIVCLTSLLSLSSIPLAANAANFVLIGIVFPLNMYLLFSILFTKSKTLIALGAISCISCVGFPWMLIGYWPLFPNTMSLCILPIFLASFIVFLGNKEETSRHDRIIAITVWILCAISYVFIQPNSIFTAAVFLAPFLIVKGSDLLCSKSRKSTSETFWRISFAAIIAIIIAITWGVLHSLPQLAAIVNYNWNPVSGKFEAFIGALTATFTGPGPQLLLGALVVIGSLSLLVKKDKNSWLVFSYALACIIYIASASLDANSTIKHLLSGFWYTDPYRVAAFCAIFSMPLISQGLYEIVLLSKKFLSYVSKQPKQTSCISILIILLFLVINFAPTFSIDNQTFLSTISALKETEKALTSEEDSNYYDDSEQEFIEEALSLIEDDSVVINQPFDGSLFAYSGNDINTYYRSISGYSTSNSESQTSRLIRSKLNEISYNQEVKQAIQNTNANYVVLLEEGTLETKSTFPTYNKEDWAGINQINENTPGFEVILQRDGMGLYRIAA